MSTRLSFYSTLLTAVIKTFPARLDYLDELFSQIIKGINTDVISAHVNEDLYQLMVSVVDNSTDVNVILSIPNFIPLFKLLTLKTPLSCHIIDKAIEQGITLKNSTEVTSCLLCSIQ